MCFMKRTVLIVLMLIMDVISYAAVNNSASISFPILDMGAGARASGMGGAFTAIADDPSAIYWNAAGLGIIKSPGFALTYNRWFMDTMFSQFLFAYPFSTGALGADIVYMNLGEMPLRDEFGTATGAIYPYIIGGSLGYGVSFGVFSTGAAVKIIRQSGGNVSNEAFAADAGMLFKTGIFSAGLSLQNAGNGSGYSLPMNINAGAAVKFVNTAEHALLIDVDSQYLFKDDFSMSVGAEYTFMDLLTLRTGYKAYFGQFDPEGLKGISAGMGIKIANIKVDYAIAPYGDLGTTHRMTLSYIFGSQAADRSTDNEKKSRLKAATNTGFDGAKKKAVKIQNKKNSKTPVKAAAYKTIKMRKKSAAGVAVRQTATPESAEMPVR